MARLSDTQKPLPLEASAAEWEHGWRVRLPTRAEHVELEKQAVIYERVVVRRREIDQLDHVAAVVRREELSVEVEGDAEGSVSTNRLGNRREQ